MGRRGGGGERDIGGSEWRGEGRRVGGSGWKGDGGVGKVEKEIGEEVEVEWKWEEMV